MTCPDCNGNRVRWDLCKFDTGWPHGAARKCFTCEGTGKVPMPLEMRQEMSRLPERESLDAHEWAEEGDR